MRTEIFNKSLTYNDYLATGNPDQQSRWMQIYDNIELSEPQKQLLAGFVRQMNVIVMSGIWCGDCVEQGPALQRISQASAKINLRYIDRDAEPGFRDKLTINAGKRVPVVIFAAEDFEFCSFYGDRTLNRYRFLAAGSLGPSCSTGLTPPESEHLAANCQDWINEFERVQLLLRLSARLRQIHKD